VKDQGKPPIGKGGLGGVAFGGKLLLRCGLGGAVFQGYMPPLTLRLTFGMIRSQLEDRIIR